MSFLKSQHQHFVFWSSDPAVEHVPPTPMAVTFLTCLPISSWDPTACSDVPSLAAWYGGRDVAKGTTEVEGDVESLAKGWVLCRAAEQQTPGGT